MTEQKKSRYLEHLPAIYHEDPFLGEFLLPFEEVLTGFEELLSTIDRYFAPALTDADFLPWLANWVALVLDEEWDETKRRQLIREAVELYRWRGTVRGLKRYLEIYTGLVPEIRESLWPGGMQIGMASRIGGTIPEDASLAVIDRTARDQPVVYHDYYVVETVAPVGHSHVPEGRPLVLYYRADRVKKVETGVEDDIPYIDIWHLSPDGEVSTMIRHKPLIGVTRRDGLIDDRYHIGIAPEIEVEYIGDTFLVDEEELPYHFVVDVRVPLAEAANVKLDKVRAIVGLEKPAHTMYYLKLTPVVSDYLLQPMQIEVRSTIGIDTIVGW